MMDRFKVGDYIVSEKTLDLHTKVKTTKSGVSVKQEWITANTPNIVKEINSDNILIDHFCKDHNTQHIVPIKELKHFTKHETDEKGYILELKWYQGIPINKTEFDTRKRVSDFEKSLKDTIKKLPANDMVGCIFKDKFSQLKVAQGAPCDTMATILKYDLDACRKDKTKRFDNMIYNRTSRWSPPILESYSYEEYKKSINFCRPIGTRPKDVCLPSELIATYTEMIKQIVCFKNINPETKQILLDFLDIDVSKCVECHKCKWCGEEIDANYYTSKYSSKDNFIEICHRDPNDRFLARNMYWGHGECNRQQGGYSETERGAQFAKLCKSNPEVREEFLKQLSS